MRKSVVLMLCVRAFLKEKIETAFTDNWRPVFVNDFDEAIRVIKHTPVSCFVVDPHSRDKEIIAQFYWQFETIPVVLYSSSSLHPDWLRNINLPEKIIATACNTLEELLSEIPIIIKNRSFQPDLKIFGINPGQYSPRI